MIQHPSVGTSLVKSFSKIRISKEPETTSKNRSPLSYESPIQRKFLKVLLLAKLSKLV